MTSGIKLIRTIICSTIFTLPGISGAQTVQKTDSLLQVNHTHDFELTGDGTSKEWNKSVWILLTKGQGTSAYETKVKLLYSDSGIYALFHCEDDTISASLKEDFANLFKEDVVEFFIWPDESLPLYLEYELSPNNYELPILIPNLGGDFYGWRPWHFTGKRATRHQTKRLQSERQHRASWRGEIFIPYALLSPLRNVPPVKGTRWRANLYRIDYDKGMTTWAWRPVKGTFHEFQKFGTIIFGD
jgi:hypothetical protein